MKRGLRFEWQMKETAANPGFCRGACLHGRDSSQRANEANEKLNLNNTFLYPRWRSFSAGKNIRATIVWGLVLFAHHITKKVLCQIPTRITAGYVTSCRNAPRSESGVFYCLMHIDCHQSHLGLSHKIMKRIRIHKASHHRGSQPVITLSLPRHCR